MKKFLYYCTLFLFLFCSNSEVFAQTAAEEEMILQRAKEKVAQLNDFISFMANPQKPGQTRNYYKKQAEHLFIFDCNPYDEVIEYKDKRTGELKRRKIQRQGVTMEVASLRKTNPIPKLMRLYFRGLIGMSYKRVEIETTDIADMRVSKLEKVNDENLYVCTVHFEQKFLGIRGDGNAYEDITRKWVVCYIQIDNTVNGIEYSIRLGDVYVDSIEAVS